MTAPDTTNLESRIDADRRRHEREMLAVLLLFLGRAKLHSLSAVRVGSDPIAASRDVLLGNPSLGLPGMAQRIAPILADAEAAGFHRTELILPGETGAVAGDPWQYLNRARLAAQQMFATLARKLWAAMGESDRGAAGLAEAIRNAFVKGGYVEAEGVQPWYLDTTALTLTTPAYGGGFLAGMNRPEVRAKLTGYFYSAVMDNNTTPICRAYDTVQLEPDHPWLLTHFPQNHFGCRSMILPLFHKFTPTANPPWTPPPAPGFGAAPAALLGVGPRSLEAVA